MTSTLPRFRSRVALYGTGILVVAALGAMVFVLGDRRARGDTLEHDRRVAEAAAGPIVAFVPARAAPPSRSLAVPGDVLAYRRVTVYAKVSGYLADLRVDRGDHVAANQVLGVVTSPETDQQIAPLEANLRTRQAIANRLAPLVPAGVATPQDLDRATADVTTARVELERLRALRGYNEIRAPFAGVVTRRYVDRGALLPAATGTTQAALPLVDIADTSRVRVIVYLGQREAPLVKEGDPVSVVRDGDPLHPVTASVTRIPRELDPRTRTMPVEIEIANTDGLFYPGVFVQVSLTIAAPAGVLIPADAVFLRDAKPNAAVIRAGHVHFVTVQIDDDDGKIARVVSGLVAGDQVATRVGDDVVDGIAVRAVEAAKPATPPKQGGTR